MYATGKDYMISSRYSTLPPSAQSQGEPQPPLELPIPAGAKIIPLPKPQDMNLPPQDLLALIEKRRTIRQYKEEPLALEELSFLLWASQGVERVSRRPVTMRTVPSAGARHAFETYLLVNRVNGLQPGFYRFAAIDHALVEVSLDPEWNPRLTHACLDQNQVATSAVTFFWVAVLERMYWRYNERSYRYLHLDAGHVCQNLYFAAEALNCGVCAIAAFDDELLNNALGVDGETQFAIYAASLGKRGG
jgi:SagB-type dehydrogenase family enzyme